MSKRWEVEPQGYEFQQKEGKKDRRLSSLLHEGGRENVPFGLLVMDLKPLQSQSNVGKASPFLSLIIPKMEDRSKPLKRRRRSLFSMTPGSVLILDKLGARGSSVGIGPIG